MPYATTNDGVKLYYEETGSGAPIVFVHEFAADHRSWEAQMRHFGQRYRCITWSARGYPPSDVPEKASSYSQARAADDILAILDHLKLDTAHIVGLSMGGFATLHFGMRHAKRARSLVVAGVGYGAEKQEAGKFKGEAAVVAKTLLGEGMEKFAGKYAYGPTRVQFQNKDPRGFAHFCAEFAKHSALGSANTLRGVQAKRPTIYQLGPKLKKAKLPLLIIAGDEDDNCVEPGVFLKQTCPNARLWICPGTGHTVNTEEPALFNLMLSEFLQQVDSGRWRPRDPRSVLLKR